LSSPNGIVVNVLLSILIPLLSSVGFGVLYCNESVKRHMDCCLRWFVCKCDIDFGRIVRHVWNALTSMYKARAPVCLLLKHQIDIALSDMPKPSKKETKPTRGTTHILEPHTFPERKLVQVKG
jgi:hypothetical protein